MIRRTTPLRPTRCPECLKGRKKCEKCRTEALVDKLYRKQFRKPNKTGAGLREKGATTALGRGKRIKRKPRSPEDSERIYGTPAHQAFLRAKSCVGCGIHGTEDHPLVLHHTATGGVSRKADARTQVPLCVRDHHLVHNPPLKGLAHLSREVLRDHAARLWAEWVSFSSVTNK